MQTQLTERFISCMNLIKENNDIPSTRQFSKLIDTHPQCISDVITGKREANAVLISKLVEIFEVNANYIFTGKGEPFMDDTAEVVVSENTPDPIITVVTDDNGSERIVFVPYAAQAGYPNQFHDPVYMQKLPSFNLPDIRFQTGTHRCFEVSGDSMEPTIFAGEQVVCSFVEKDNWQYSVKSNYVYVIVTQSGIIIKRIVNNISSDRQLEIRSDNSFYDAFNIPIADVKEIWLVTHKISPFMPSPSNIRNALHMEVDNLRMTISDQGKMIQSLNSTIEKMLKQNRQLTVRY